MALFNFFLPIIVFALIIVGPYYIILGGFKLLRIREVPRSKIFIFYFIVIATAFLTEKFLNSFTISSQILYRAISNFIYLVVNFLLLKYYFQLSGKKLWQFLVYLILAGLILSLLISLPSMISS